jgi:hypothetical protein
MGQAKRRASEKKQWLDSLTGEERVIADTAERLLHKFLEPTGATGMCYRMTFFLHLYLAERGIKTIPVVGYVNDGSDNVMISHAWLDYKGKRTDVTLANSGNPDLNPIGQVIILDRIVRNGCAYSYHLEKSPEALTVENQWLREPAPAQIVQIKRVEHSAMLDRATSALKIRNFLDAAPDKITFKILKAKIDS